MDVVVELGNMKAALKRVKANKGAAGVDGMSVDALLPYLQERWPRIKEELLAGQYVPSPVRLVEIPKPGGRPAALGDSHGAGPPHPTGVAPGFATAV